MTTGKALGKVTQFITKSLKNIQCTGLGVGGGGGGLCILRYPTVTVRGFNTCSVLFALWSDISMAHQPSNVHKNTVS